jgi:DUF917 family protein
VRLDESSLSTLAGGCAVLGGGGGGDPSIGLVMALRAVADHGAVALVGIDDLPADGLIMPCGLIGAPTVTIEKIWRGDEGARLREAVEELWARPVIGVMPYEIAGANGLLPLAWAAGLGLPLVDADGMGRAFPEMHQLAMHLAGLSASPLIMADERANVVVIQAQTNEWAERLARGVAASFGGVAAGSLYQMTVGQARRAVIRGSVTRALTIGRALEGATEDPAAAVIEAVGGRELIEGKVIDVERRTTDGFARGSAVVEGIGPDANRLLRLELQNEVLAALADGEVAACVPDVISVLDAQTGASIVTERLRYGQRVRVITFLSDPVWRTAAGLAVVGPRAFGYDFSYSAPAEPVLEH